MHQQCQKTRNPLPSQFSPRLAKAPKHFEFSKYLHHPQRSPTDDHSAQSQSKSLTATKIQEELRLLIRFSPITPPQPTYHHHLPRIPVNPTKIISWEPRPISTLKLSLTPSPSILRSQPRNKNSLQIRKRIYKKRQTPTNIRNHLTACKTRTHQRGADQVRGMNVGIMSYRDGNANHGIAEEE